MKKKTFVVGHHLLWNLGIPIDYKLGRSFIVKSDYINYIVLYPCHFFHFLFIFGPNQIFSWPQFTGWLGSRL